MEDGESAYCMYTVLHFHWKPSDFAKLNHKEKAFVIACIDERVQSEKEELAKIRRMN